MLFLKRFRHSSPLMISKRWENGVGGHGISSQSPRSWQQPVHVSDNHVVGSFGASECLEAPNLFLVPCVVRALVSVCCGRMRQPRVTMCFFYLLAPQRAGHLSCGSLHIGDESRGSAPPTASGGSQSERGIHQQRDSYNLPQLRWPTFAQCRRRKVQVTFFCGGTVKMRHAPAASSLKEETGSLDKPQNRCGHGNEEKNPFICWESNSGRPDYELVNRFRW